VSGTLQPDFWARLRQATPARVALGRAGSAMPTQEVLGFGLAHARARDAVHLAMDADVMRQEIAALGLEVFSVRSAAADRHSYLRRPDLGRRLDAASRAALQQAGPRRRDVALVVADGLSSTAVHQHAAPFLRALLPLLPRAAEGVVAVVAAQARVALGDEIGELLASRLVLVLIGERPGLSSPDSLGLYLTYAPRVGRSDAERNCVSNVRGEGLSYAAAAAKMAWLMDHALRRSLTGVGLKDQSEGAAPRIVAAAQVPALGGPGDDATLA
jgi:ethanolamine ammonia-lyase small subunit